MDTNIDLKITNKLISDFMDTGYWEYHDDWNLIMAVVEKINGIELNTKLPKESDGWYAYYGLEVSLTLVDKPMVIKDIIKFIKWYGRLSDNS